MILEWGVIASAYALGIFSGLALAIVIGLSLGPARGRRE